MSELLKINVNDHTERKNGLTYLSWAWAWAEVLKIDPSATWEAAEFNGLPCAFLPDSSALVKTSVTIKGHTKTCWLPVMDHKNKAIKGPDAFAVNTAIVRCLTKCIGMHGLGLYIYAGEDLPEGEQQEAKPVGIGHTGQQQGESYLAAMDEEQQAYIRQTASRVTKGCQDGFVNLAYDYIAAQGFGAEEKIALNSLLDSKVRAALKEEGQKRRVASTVKEAA